MDSSRTSVVVDRWMGVGQSAETDVTVATATALAGAVADRPDPQLLIAFCGPGSDLPAVSQTLAARAPNVPAIGCTTAGEITTAGPSDATIVICALGGGGFTIEPFSVADIGEDMCAAGRRAASQIDPSPARSYRVMLTLSDALAGDQQELISGMYDALGPGTPVVGGCAGDGLRMEMTRQFIGTSVLTNAVVGAAIGSDAPFGLGIRHGWEAVGRPMLVTHSTPTEVVTIDSQPALDAYLDKLDAPPAARSDAAAFTAFALEHPLGIARRADEPYARFITSADFERRTISTVAVVPEGSYVWPMRGNQASVADATDVACRTALTGLDRDPVGMIVFDCVGRRQVLGLDGIRDEVERIAGHANGAPIAGFYTYGEIGRIEGLDGFHNETMVVLAVA